MSDKEYIRNLVKKHKSKMNAVGITRWTIICLSAGLLAALLVELYSFIWPFYYADIVAIVLMVLGAAAGLVIGFMKRKTEREAALDIDSAGFRERIVTAYEGLDKDDAIYEIQRKDAVKVAKAGASKIRVKREGLPKLVCVFTFLFAAVITSFFLPSKTKARAKEIHILNQKIDDKKDDIDDLKDELDKLKDELKDSLTDDEKKKIQDMIDSLEASKQELDKAETQEEYDAAKDKLDFKLDDISEKLDNMADVKEKIDNDPDSAQRMRDAAQEAEKKKEDSTTEQNTGSGQQGGSTDTQQGSGSDTQQGGGTDTQQGGGTDTQQGGGTDTQQGGGTDTQQGGGTDTQQGGGTDTQQGGGTDTQQGGGTDTQQGGGTDTQQGGGTDTQQGGGTDTQQGGGTDTQQGGGEGQNPGGEGQNPGGEGQEPGTGQQPGGNGRGEGTASNDHDYVSIPGSENVDIEGNGSGTGESGYGSTNNGPAWSGNHVNYDEVIGRYEQDAYEGIESGKYPSGMEDVIKDYFGNLLED